MKRRPFELTQILTDAQVELLTEAVNKMLGAEFIAASSRLDVDTRRHLRFQAVAHCCAAAREQLGLDMRQVAARLKVPQYRLKAIERGQLREIRTEVLAAYVSFLGLDPWLRRWVRANPVLAVELGINQLRPVSRAVRIGSSRRWDTPSNPALEPSAPSRSRAPRLGAKR